MEQILQVDQNNIVLLIVGGSVVIFGVVVTCTAICICRRLQTIADARLMNRIAEQEHTLLREQSMSPRTMTSTLSPRDEEYSMDSGVSPRE